MTLAAERVATAAVRAAGVAGNGRLSENTGRVPTRTTIRTRRRRKGSFHHTIRTGVLYTPCPGDVITVSGQVVLVVSRWWTTGEWTLCSHAIVEYRGSQLILYPE
jgi:hypothetical protein